MSQIQPCFCAVDTVCGTISLSSASYGTCTAKARSMNSTSLQSTKGTPIVSPSSSDLNPEQSMKRSPSSCPDLLVSRQAMSPASLLITLVTSSTTCWTPSRLTQ